MQILVIGGTNFIGPYVVRRLIELGHEVTVFHRGTTEAKLPPETKQKMGDRRRLKDHTEELQRYAPEIVLDMIPMNEHDARNVMQVFRGIARRVVAISSQDVYQAYDILRRRHPGPPDPVPLTEDAPLREKLYPYDREGAEEYEKILVEKEVIEDLALPGTILRLPMVYGPGDYQHRLFPYLKRMDDRRPAILLEEGMARWRWICGYVEDVAHAIVLAVIDERAAGRTYNVGEYETSSYADWVRSIGRVSGWNGDIIEVPADSIPTDLRFGGNFNQHLVTDTKRIRQELGYKETTLQQEALLRTVEWERSNPPEDIDPSAFDYVAEDAVLDP
ncbi:N/A [soil metagenome]